MLELKEMNVTTGWLIERIEAGNTIAGSRAGNEFWLKAIDRGLSYLPE